MILLVMGDIDTKVSILPIPVSVLLVSIMLYWHFSSKKWPYFQAMWEERKPFHSSHVVWVSRKLQTVDVICHGLSGWSNSK